MKLRLLLGLSLLLAVNPAWGQGLPLGISRTEVFVGGTYYRAGISNGLNLAGWHTAFDYNLHKRVSVVFDLAGEYKTTSGITLGLYQYMVGPRFKYRSGRFTAFGEGLVGGAAAHVPSHTQGAFATGVGGGLDLNEGRIVSIRLFQIDYIADHSGGGWGHNIRASAGVVLRFPRHPFP